MKILPTANTTVEVTEREESSIEKPTTLSLYGVMATFVLSKISFLINIL